MWETPLKTLGKMWDFSQKYLEKCEKCITFVALINLI